MELPPRMIGFKPFGIPLSQLESVELLFEEYESIRLADYDNLNQEEAAKKMGVSRPTFTRIYDKARKTIAKAFTEGKVISIKGGSVEFEKEWFRCNTCDETFNSRTSNPDSCKKCDSEDITNLSDNDTPEINQKNNVCYCLTCDIKIDHEPGKPCRKIACPKCGNSMTGANIK